MEAKSFYNFYSDKGFRFKPEILTRYCLSLYTKPFVILSGISGTGKTKIAQLFNLPIKESFKVITSEEEVAKDDIPKEWITLTVREGMLIDGRGNLPVSSLEAIFEADEMPEINRRIDELKGLKRDDNITEASDITILDRVHEKTVKAKVYLQRASSPLVRVRFKSKRGEEDYDSREYFSTFYNVGDVIGLQKVGIRQFEIVAVNEKPLIDLSIAERKKELSLIDNFHFASVRSDWTDASPIIGFYNLVTQKYYVPPILKFILRAIENPEIPFFLLLDEMNLSKVEHYFSDILSCMESRYLIEGESIKQERIKLYGSLDILETDDYEFSMIASEIPVPLNLYITGTVNIDESTYMFSPKVLDRANVIEFNEVELVDYEKDVNLDDEIFLLQDIPKFGQAKLASKIDYKDSPELLKHILTKLIETLKPFNLHFGYRTVNEISLFVNNCVEYIGKDDTIVEKAIDIQIVQKILPKFNGSFNKLDEPLRILISILLINAESAENVNIELINSIVYEKEKFPLSLHKLSIMYLSLVNNGFASYIE